METIQVAAATAEFVTEGGLEIEIQILVRDPEAGFANLVVGDVLSFLRDYTQGEDPSLREDILDVRELIDGTGEFA